MNQYGIKFKRKTPQGYKSWCVSTKIYADTQEDANRILNLDITPFIEEKLGDEVIELELEEGKFIGEVPATTPRDENPHLDYMHSLDAWFIIPMLETYKHLLSKDELHQLVTFFIEASEYEICDQLNELRKQTENINS